MEPIITWFLKFIADKSASLLLCSGIESAQICFVLLASVISLNHQIRLE